jgi:hypothetical protein
VSVSPWGGDESAGLDMLGAAGEVRCANDIGSNSFASLATGVDRTEAQADGERSTLAGVGGAISSSGIRIGIDSGCGS